MSQTYQCRICLENDKRKSLIAPCLCKGSIKYVHNECLNKWRYQNKNNLSQCDMCKFRFIILPDNGEKKRRQEYVQAVFLTITKMILSAIIIVIII